MRDGSGDTWKNELSICTECFTFQEIEVLIQLLQENFRLETRPKRRIVNRKVIGHRILFNNSVENMLKLQNRVMPYMHPQILYKINKKLNNSKK